MNAEDPRYGPGRRVPPDPPEPPEPPEPPAPDERPAGQPEAAGPVPWRPAGIRYAVILVAVLLVAMFGAAVIGSLHRDRVSLFNLAGLLFVGVVAAHTYFVVWIYRRYQDDPRQRRLLLLIATAALGVLLLIWLSVITGVMTLADFPAYVAALPFTLGGLWLLRNLQLNRKESWKLVLVTIAWGIMIAPDLALLTESVYSLLLGDSLIPGIGAGVAQAISPAVFEEGGKGLAVVLLFLLFRNEFDDVVSGIVLGALVGLGFNFLETGSYVASAFQEAGLAGAIVQLGYRQVLGLLMGHVAYTALIGAGIGVARQQRVGWKKAVTFASGFVVAIAAHFLWDLVAMTGLFPTTEDALADLLIVTPLQYLVLDGTFALMAVTLLVMGLRRERAALEVELRAEAGTGLGAITEPELPWLLHPARRTALRWRTLSGRGVRDWLWLHRLQEAQLTLAMERWHRRRQEVGEPLEAEARLRQQVLALKARVPER